MTTAYHVYSNAGNGGPINYSTPIATTYNLTFQTSALSVPGVWSFGVRAFDDATLLQELNLDCSVTITLSSAGANISGIPSAPIGLNAIPQANGAMLVEWTYPISANTPTIFYVYLGTGGSPSYASPVAIVVASDGSLNPRYSATLTGLTDGTTYSIGVRAANLSGEESNTNEVSAMAVVAGPLAVSSLSISVTT